MLESLDAAEASETRDSSDELELDRRRPPTRLRIDSLKVREDFGEAGTARDSGVKVGEVGDAGGGYADVVGTDGAEKLRTGNRAAAKEREVGDAGEFGDGREVVELSVVGEDGGTSEAKPLLELRRLPMNDIEFRLITLFHLGRFGVGGADAVAGRGSDSTSLGVNGKTGWS